MLSLCVSLSISLFLFLSVSLSVGLCLALPLSLSGRGLSSMRTAACRDPAVDGGALKAVVSARGRQRRVLGVEEEVDRVARDHQVNEHDREVEHVLDLQSPPDQTNNHSDDERPQRLATTANKQASHTTCRCPIMRIAASRGPTRQRARHSGTRMVASRMNRRGKQRTESSPSQEHRMHGQAAPRPTVRVLVVEVVDVAVQKLDVDPPVHSVEVELASDRDQQKPGDGMDHRLSPPHSKHAVSAPTPPTAHCLS